MKIRDHAAARFDDRFQGLSFKEEYESATPFGGQFGDHSLLISKNDVVFVCRKNVIITVLTKEQALCNIQAMHYTAWHHMQKSNKALSASTINKIEEIAREIEGSLTKGKIIKSLKKGGIHAHKETIDKLKQLHRDYTKLKNRKPKPKPKRLKDDDDIE